MADLSLLVLAAGMGSRYGGLKQLAPVGPGGATLLDYSVFDALRAGFDRIVFVIRRDFEAEFRERIGARYEQRVPVHYVFQDLADLPPGFSVPPDRQKPWGTGHAILCAREALEGSFLAINADDFYGADAYRQLAVHLRQGGPREFFMAGYRLEKTLSPHGSVARGICQVDAEGLLLSVREMTRLVKTDTGARDELTGESFSGDEPVSMNFWGFTPQIFPMLQEGFSEFLRTCHEDPKSEYYIPMAVGSFIASGIATVRVARTEAEWFGVTYREDRPEVVRRLEAFTAQGIYPASLDA